MLLVPALAAMVEDAVAELVAVIVAAPDELLPVALDLDTVTGTLDPLTAGKPLRVVQPLPLSGHTSVRFRFLFSGPVGPDSYFHETPRFRKLTCRGSLSGYRSSPQRPRKESQATGVEGSAAVKVPFTGEVGVYV